MSRLFRAAVLVEFRQDLVVEELELLPVGDDDVVVHTAATACCATDCTNRRGELGKTPPTILGHTSVGVVERVGDGVRHVHVGDHVVVPGTPQCGQCFYCARDRADQCSELFDATTPRQVALRSDGEVVSAAGNIGGYAEVMHLSQNHVFPVETRLGDEVLAMLGCGITSGVGSVFNVAHVEPGASVAVVGCGHLGLWMVQAARIAGASPIVAVDPLADGREVALELGATDVVDPAHGEAVDAVRRLTGGRGVDYGFEAAGPPDGLADAFAMTRHAGVVVATGVERLGSSISFDQFQLALAGRDLRSSQNGRARMRRDIPRFIELLERGELRTEPIISRTYPLADINAALDAASTHHDLTGVIVL